MLRGLNFALQEQVVSPRRLYMHAKGVCKECGLFMLESPKQLAVQECAVVFVARFIHLLFEPVAYVVDSLQTVSYVGRERGEISVTNVRLGSHELFRVLVALLVALPITHCIRGLR